MNINDQFSASSLYAGGWRASDYEDLKEEYALTDEEATSICAELVALECEEVLSYED